MGERMLIELDPQSWEDGYQAGMSGKSSELQNVYQGDRLAWISGFLDGKSRREAGAIS